MLLKASASAMEVDYMTASGAPLPGLTMSGAGLLGYWLTELAITAGVAGVMNYNYAKRLYCDNCNAWYQYKTPVIGTDANLEATIEQLQQCNIPAALELLGKNPEGHSTRLQLIFCPLCYDNRLSKLIVVKDTGPKTWAEYTVWADRFEPQYVHQIIKQT